MSKSEVITIDGVTITPKIIKALKEMQSIDVPQKIKDNLTSLLFMLSLNKESRARDDFEDGVFLLYCFYHIAESLAEEEGGDNA